MEINQRFMDRGTGMHLLLNQLPPLEWVTLFTGEWCAEEREAGRNSVQELTREK